MPVIDTHYARSFGYWAHRAQTYGDEPYSKHLDAVAQILIDTGFSGEILCAAYLHDVLEDTGTTRGFLEHRFGRLIADLVWEVRGEGKTRRARNLSVCHKLALYPLAKDLKTADRIANVEAAVRGGTDCKHYADMYRREQDEFLRAVDGAHPVLLARLHTALAAAESGS